MSVIFWGFRFFLCSFKSNMSSIISTKDKEDECRKITPVMIMEHTGENSLHDVNCLVLRGMNVSDFDSLEYVSLSLSNKTAGISYKIYMYIHKYTRIILDTSPQKIIRIPHTQAHTHNIPYE